MKVFKSCNQRSPLRTILPDFWQKLECQDCWEIEAIFLFQANQKLASKWARIGLWPRDLVLRQSHCLVSYGKEVLQYWSVQAFFVLYLIFESWQSDDDETEDDVEKDAKNRLVAYFTDGSNSTSTSQLSPRQLESTKIKRKTKTTSKTICKTREISENKVEHFSRKSAKKSATKDRVYDEPDRELFTSESDCRRLECSGRFSRRFENDRKQNEVVFFHREGNEVRKFRHFNDDNKRVKVIIV